MIDESEYKEKIQQHLSNTDTYQEVNRNPIKTLVSKVNRELPELKKLKKLATKNYQWMRCNKEVIPKFYATINPLTPRRTLEAPFTKISILF